MASQALSWLGPFQYTGMVKFAVPADGSCFFHSILMASNQSYRLGKQGETPASRSSLVKTLRVELANLLASPLDPLDPTSSRYYDVLARGNLKELSVTFPNLTLENMQNVLAGQDWIDYTYFEFVALALNKDIYILDGSKQDVYLTADQHLYQRGNPSIVLHYHHHHYEPIGVIDPKNGSIRMLFHPEDTFIRAIKHRQSQLQH